MRDSSRQRAHSTWLITFFAFYRRPRLLLLVLLILCGLTTAQAADYYVAPLGTSAGNGSITSPWNIQTAFSQPSTVKPGDTIWLRGGVYGSGGRTMFFSTLQGTATAPIIVRGYPNERAMIDGGITSNGAYTWFWGFEITNSANITRNIAIQEDRSPGLTLYGLRNKVINMVIHDTGHPGIGFWNSVGDGGEVYGTIFWGIGNYIGTALTGQGSAIYAQNKDGTRYIRDTISFKNVTTGFKAFTTNTYANGFWIEGNTTFMNGEWDIFTVSRNIPLERLKVVSNYTYKIRTHSEPSFQFGYDLDSDPNKDIVITDNYFAGGSPGEAGRGAVTGGLFTNVTFLRNTVISQTKLLHWFPCNAAHNCNPAGFTESYVWDNNTYYQGGTSTTPFRLSGAGKTFAQWQSETGFDANSSFTPGRPTQNKVFIRPNLYERGRANITIYNWQNLTTVQVNISSAGLQDGEHYEIRDAQNLYGNPVASGLYNSSSPEVNIPMTGLIAAPFIGSLPTVSNAHTTPEFAVFVVVPIP